MQMICSQRLYAKDRNEQYAESTKFLRGVFYSLWQKSLLILHKWLDFYLFSRREISGSGSGTICPMVLAI